MDSTTRTHGDRVETVLTYDKETGEIRIIAATIGDDNNLTAENAIVLDRDKALRLYLFLSNIFAESDRLN
ncbi:hypothetical protein [Paenibacillus sp. YIM B09110]|uniref:hypothetical protein n=1 Tax=Paenibacillus sp. YIM B09110 TaxID=3126102 RepID=UPI00301E369B